MVIFHSYVTVYQRVTNLWFPVVPSISEKSPVAPLLASPSQWTLEIVGPTMKSVLCYGAGCSTSRNQSFTYYKMMVFLHHGFSLLPAVTVIMLHIITGESLASLKRPAKVIAQFLVGEHHSSTPKTSFQEVSKDITNHNFYRWYGYHSQMGGLWHYFTHITLHFQPLSLVRGVPTARSAKGGHSTLTVPSSPFLLGQVADVCWVPHICRFPESWG